MRLSANPTDAGFKAFRGLARKIVVRVTLDGKEVRRCITVDTRRGFVLLVASDPLGNLQLNASGDCFAMRRLYGRVEIDLVRS